MTHDTQNNMILIYSSMILIFLKKSLFFLNFKSKMPEKSNEFFLP